MIAEEQASFVYPEIKFNHFPITAVAILSRRMGARAAERMLMSGEEMSAQAFFEAGGLEAVVPTGRGEAWIRKYAQDSLPMHAAKTALFSAFNRRAGDLQQELDERRAKAAALEALEANLRESLAELAAIEERVERIRGLKEQVAIKLRILEAPECK
jgi:enoyl-CoA hydratase/carnithine racemase